MAAENGPPMEHAPPVDKERLRASLDQMYEIYKQIIKVADQVSLSRCPYKSRKSHCTAQFRCRNQRPLGEQERSTLDEGDSAQSGCPNQRPLSRAAGPAQERQVGGEASLCAGDDKLNYRKAWET
ncbi:MAG: hypothetical protein HYY04_05735 [Chloroflexi bacterium]|nr:hypothetical protein [Chloroflexota bacterium]